MRNNKRWIAVTVLAGVTAAALVTSVLVKNNMNKGPANAIELTQEAKDSGIKSVEVIKDDNGNVTGYKVNVDAKGFGEPAMDLMITFNEKADTVVSLEVISQNETEGLGSNVTKPEFLDQFNNVKLPVYIEGMDVAINEIVETFSLASFEATTVSAPAFVDGTYEVVADEAHNGWLSKVTLTVENGAITNVVWDCENEEGKLKSVLSQNGEYKMTDDGAIWADQAKALADYVVANQGLEGLTMDENGKTDAVATVSISINE
ncbi:MAG: FMN-binding protein, partial [Clostridiales bacterium]|nr:FMN-binding protein [Clostridiales bacterium]